MNKPSDESTSRPRNFEQIVRERVAIGGVPVRGHRFIQCAIVRPVVTNPAPEPRRGVRWPGMK